MLHAMRILEKQAGRLILEKTIGTAQKQNSVWDVPARDLALLEQKLSLSQISIVPDTRKIMMEESKMTQDNGLKDIVGVSNTPSVDMDIGANMGLSNNLNTPRPVEVVSSSMSL